MKKSKRSKIKSTNRKAKRKTAAPTKRQWAKMKEAQQALEFVTGVSLVDSAVGKIFRAGQRGTPAARAGIAHGLQMLANSVRMGEFDAHAHAVKSHG